MREPKKSAFSLRSLRVLCGLCDQKPLTAEIAKRTAKTAEGPGHRCRRAAIPESGLDVDLAGLSAQESPRSMSVIACAC